ncbi:MAG: hypothetical protein A4E19_02290 [Nitrospira sp. SG-bin1]|nr:MAG: hypothetical protein A4E19_02290 [Nitrospira sp. SG-bin1]
MEGMLIGTAIIFGALMARYRWEARVRRSNIEELNQATAARDKEREGSRCRMYVTQDGSVQAIPCMGRRAG